MPANPKIYHILHVDKLQSIINSGGLFSDAEDAPEKQIELIPRAVVDSTKFLNRKDSTNDSFQKVIDLVSGFETPFGLELLSTVHWTMKQENTTDTEKIVSSIYNWNDRKKQFSKH